MCWRNQSKGTSMTQEAFKLAMEAFGEIEWSNNSQWQSDRAKVAITAVKKALAKEKALQDLHDENERLGLYKDAYAEQEPVAYDKTELNCFAQDLYDQKMREGRRGHYESMFHVIHQCIKKVAPQPEQEPVAYLCENAVGHKYFRWKKPSSTYKPIALYTSPPAQRKPLTDEHPLVVFAKECVLGAYKESELGDAARRAIEAAYNIKGKP